MTFLLFGKVGKFPHHFEEVDSKTEHSGICWNIWCHFLVPNSILGMSWTIPKHIGNRCPASPAHDPLHPRLPPLHTHTAHHTPTHKPNTHCVGVLNPPRLYSCSWGRIYWCPTTSKLIAALCCLCVGLRPSCLRSRPARDQHQYVSPAPQDAPHDYRQVGRMQEGRTRRPFHSSKPQQTRCTGCSTLDGPCNSPRTPASLSPTIQLRP